MTLDPDPSKAEAFVPIVALVRTANRWTSPAAKGNACCCPQPQAPGPGNPTQDVGRLFPWFISCLISCLIGDRRVTELRRLSAAAATRQGIPAIQVPGWSVFIRQGRPIPRSPALLRHPPPLMLRALARSAFRCRSARGKSQPFELRCHREAAACPQGLRQKERPAGLSPQRRCPSRWLRGRWHH